DLLLDLLVDGLLLVVLVLQRLDLRGIGTRRRQRRQLHGDVHDRPIEEVPGQGEAGREKQHAAHHAAQYQWPAGSWTIGVRVAFGHDSDWAVRGDASQHTTRKSWAGLLPERGSPGPLKSSVERKDAGPEACGPARRLPSELVPRAVVAADQHELAA